MKPEKQEELALELTKAIITGRGKETSIDEAIEMYLLAVDKVKTRLPYRAPKVQTIY
jgi:hypothetical protein|nr:MAG TPA: hypothetical protein [Caudoviricetes sp.]